MFLDSEPNVLPRDVLETRREMIFMLMSYRIRLSSKGKPQFVGIVSLFKVRVETATL